MADKQARQTAPLDGAGSGRVLAMAQREPIDSRPVSGSGIGKRCGKVEVIRPALLSRSEIETAIQFAGLYYANCMI